MDGYNKVVALVGATGTGKSALADALAVQLDAELIGADSIQVYRGMDIGTAKTPLKQRSVPYHCIDLVAPNFVFTAALYQREARRTINGVLSRGISALVCGGTGLYVRAALDDFRFDENRELYSASELSGLTVLQDDDQPQERQMTQNKNLRQRLTAQAEELGAKAFHALLTTRDPDSAALIHPNNVRRVVRAFEFLEQGSSYAQQQEGFASFKAFYPTQYIGISVAHEVLYEVIERRVDQMVAAGLLKEVEGLVEAGFKDAPALRQAIGYKELLPVLEGERSLDEAIAEIKQSTRRYAKRQRTWFKRDPRIEWIDATVEHRLRLAGEIDAEEFTRRLLSQALKLLEYNEGLESY